MKTIRAKQAKVYFAYFVRRDEHGIIAKHLTLTQSSILHKLLSESEKLKRSNEKIVFHICSVLSLSLLVEKPRCEQALTEILRELIM